MNVNTRLERKDISNEIEKQKVSFVRLFFFIGYLDLAYIDRQTQTESSCTVLFSTIIKNEKDFIET